MTGYAGVTVEWKLLPYRPLLTNPHAQTILGHFWPRNLNTEPYPIQSELFQTDADTRVLVQTQQPLGPPRGSVIMVHGLEGSGEAGYICTMAQTALEAGYIAHRFHMRTCGRIGPHSKTLYHAGLTSDLLSVVRQLQVRGETPVHLMGYSLGGNVATKLAGELGSDALSLFASICAISTPLDLDACARHLAEPANRFYEQRFLRRMRERVLASGLFSAETVAAPRTLWEFDDRITAPSFGFQGAEHYYRTQSCRNFLERIRVPTLFLQARDDIFIPFRVFDHPAFQSNPMLQLTVTDHGGHVGFLSRERPRFWADQVAIAWIASHSGEAANQPDDYGAKKPRISSIT